MNTSGRKTYLIAAGFVPLWVYIFMIAYPGHTIMGIGYRTSFWWFGFVAGVFVIAVLSRYLGSRVHNMPSLSAMALMAFVSLVIIDVGYGFYYGRYVAVDEEAPVARDLELIDPTLWQSNFAPDQYFPTEQNFVTYKPSVSAEGFGYGQAYYPGLVKSDRLVENVLTWKAKKYSIDSNGFKETLMIEDASVFVIGDLFTADVSTRQSDTWHEVLERNTNVPIYNMGVGGHSPQNSLLLLRNQLESAGIGKNIDRLCG